LTGRASGLFLPLIGESQGIKCAKGFAVGIVEMFGEVYLRVFNAQDTTRLLKLKFLGVFMYAWFN
jgi:hypothetical protein